MNNQPVALITGASRGLGASIAVQFAKQGYDVIGVYRSNQAAAEQVSLDIETLGRKALFINADVSSVSDVQTVFKKAEEVFPRIDVLVNNAGTVANKTIYAMSDDEWNRVMNVNVTGAFYLTRGVLPIMRRQKSGVIINMTSYLTARPNKGAANYAASKAALESLTKSIAIEEGEFNIRANAVMPGFHVTEMNADVWAKFENKIRGAHMVQKMPVKEELASFVVQVAELTSVSGQVFSFESRLI